MIRVVFALAVLALSGTGCFTGFTAVLVSEHGCYERPAGIARIASLSVVQESDRVLVRAAYDPTWGSGLQEARATSGGQVVGAGSPLVVAGWTAGLGEGERVRSVAADGTISEKLHRMTREESLACTVVELGLEPGKWGGDVPVTLHFPRGGRREDGSPGKFAEESRAVPFTLVPPSSRRGTHPAKVIALIPLFTLTVGLDLATSPLQLTALAGYGIYRLGRKFTRAMR